MTDDSVLRELDHMSRRMDGLDARLQALDEHGSRGLSGLIVQMTELSKDIGALEVELKRVAHSRWQGWVAFVVALLPVYIFIVEQLINR